MHNILGQEAHGENDHLILLNNLALTVFLPHLLVLVFKQTSRKPQQDHLFLLPFSMPLVISEVFLDLFLRDLHSILFRAEESSLQKSFFVFDELSLNLF